MPQGAAIHPLGRSSPLPKLSALSMSLNWHAWMFWRALHSRKPQGIGPTAKLTPFNLGVGMQRLLNVQATMNCTNHVIDALRPLIALTCSTHGESFFLALARVEKPILQKRHRSMNGCHHCPADSGRTDPLHALALICVDRDTSTAATR